MTRNSTDFYRQNREQHNKGYSCHHCDYITWNSRACLNNHINAKHTKEENKPFQCDYCSRGFSQKAHLCLHCEKEHNIIIKERHIVAVAYIIKSTNEIPRSKKTKARREYYKTHDVIKSTELNNKKHEYLPGVFMKQHDIHYDARKGFIKLHKCPLWK
tara:strand:+ start:701 stop:1174 length:474 start_codon:yes stop_codon:yes gene_type:complete